MLSDSLRCGLGACRGECFASSRPLRSPCAIFAFTRSLHHPPIPTYALRRLRTLFARTRTAAKEARKKLSPSQRERPAILAGRAPKNCLASITSLFFPWLQVTASRNSSGVDSCEWRNSQWADERASGKRKCLVHAAHDWRSTVLFAMFSPAATYALSGGAFVSLRVSRVLLPEGQCYDRARETISTLLSTTSPPPLSSESRRFRIFKSLTRRSDLPRTCLSRWRSR